VAIRLVLWLELCFVPTTIYSCLVNIWTQILKMGPTKNWVHTANFDEAKNCCFSLFIARLLPHVQNELIHSAQCSLQEVNTAKWINSLGTVHVNSARWINSRVTIHVNSDFTKKNSLARAWPEKKFNIFLIVFYSKTSI
jgi:hypothetical protein